MSDRDLEQIVSNIADMALGADDLSDPNTQWHLGYQQACRDIVLMVARLAKSRDSLTQVLPDDEKTL